MTGKHHIVLEAKRLKYEFDIKRNITVILGDSATGKTTLVGLLSAYGQYTEGSGIRLDSDVPCLVFASTAGDWKAALANIENSIIFIDEDHSFVFSDDFAGYVSGNSNYFVIITRRPLMNLPYSIEEVYGIRTVGRYHFPEKVYHEFYHIYDSQIPARTCDKYTFLLEDSGAGLDFYKNAFGDMLCRSSNGNANIANTLKGMNGSAVVVADGAAFGAYMERVLAIAEEKENIILYLPESFEWLILRSGIVGSAELVEILETPETYIDSKEYVSWERYFAALLQHLTEDDPVKQYSKIKLLPFYYTEKNKESILGIMPDEIRCLAVDK